MKSETPRESNDVDAGEPRSRMNPLVTVVVVVVLTVSGWFLVQNLTAASKIQDCTMSGRRNCAPIDPNDVPK